MGTQNRNAGRTVVKLFDLGLGHIAAATCLLFSLPLYQSFSSRPVFDRWSYPFVAFAVVVTAVWSVLVVRAVSVVRRRQRPVTGDGSTRLLQAAAIAWGVAYLVAALRSPTNAGRVLELDLFGSLVPISAFLEWIALTLVSIVLVMRSARWVRGKWVGPWSAAASLVAVLLILEGIARGKAILVPTTQGYPTHSTQLWEQRYVKLNSMGFRDREHAVARNRSEHRLLVIGDSYAFGVGVTDPEDRFGERLAARLTQAGDGNWESINASLGNTHTLDHLDFLARSVVLRPDVIILLYVFNDIDYLRRVTTSGPITNPQSALEKLHPARLLFLNSYAFQEVVARWRHIPFVAKKMPDPYADSAALDTHMRDVKRFADRALKTGARVAVVPFDITVSFEARSQQRYDRFVRRAAAAGIPVWPIDSAFHGQDYRALIVNVLDQHPNAHAHDLAAKQIATHLLQSSDTSGAQR